jgi:hypothetical protein
MNKKIERNNGVHKDNTNQNINHKNNNSLPRSNRRIRLIGELNRVCELRIPEEFRLPRQ